MKKNRKSNEEMNKLSKAITRALLKSDEVLEILDTFKKNDLLKADAMIAFILKANDLLAISQKEVPAAEKMPKAVPAGLLNPAPLSSKSGEFIDGKKLSENEIKFEEYCALRFDEGEWMKKANITLA